MLSDLGCKNLLPFYSSVLILNLSITEKVILKLNFSVIKSFVYGEVLWGNQCVQHLKIRVF